MSQAASAKGKKKSWPVIGSLRKSEHGNYIKLNDNVKILVDGQEVEMNEKRVVTLDDPRKKVEMLLERGIIDEAEAMRRQERFSSMPWLRYELVCAPNKSK